LEIVVEPENKDYPWTTDKDEMLRSFIFQTMADLVYDVSIMDSCYKWIKHGVIPEAAKPKPRHLKSVD
jgi:hypothetical protein